MSKKKGGETPRIKIIEKIMKRLGLNQYRLAKELELQSTSIASIRKSTGRVDLRKLAPILRIAKKGGISDKEIVEWILEEER